MGTRTRRLYLWLKIMATVSQTRKKLASKEQSGVRVKKTVWKVHVFAG